MFLLASRTIYFLGTGPMLTNTSGPRLVNTLHDLKVTPLSVSCGRKHTLCATDCGVSIFLYLN